MNIQKTCNICLETKCISNFTKNSSNKNGHIKQCKPCVAKRVRAYYKTLQGLKTRIYNSEKQASKGRNHSPPDYSKEELFTWLDLNGIKDLYNTWVKSGYSKDLSPSVDRVDSTKPYSLDNIQLGTWKQNNDAAYIERKNCKRITKQCKSVNQYTLEGAFITTFGSISHAARETDSCRTHINSVCKGKQPHANGFIWKYTNT